MLFHIIINIIIMIAVPYLSPDKINFKIKAISTFSVSDTVEIKLRVGKIKSIYFVTTLKLYHINLIYEHT